MIKSKMMMIVMVFVSWILGGNAMAIPDARKCSVHETINGVMKRGRGDTTKELFGREPFPGLSRDHVVPVRRRVAPPTGLTCTGNGTHVAIPNLSSSTQTPERLRRESFVSFHAERT
jgi:hypothetical protein